MTGVTEDGTCWIGGGGSSDFIVSNSFSVFSVKILIELHS